MPDKVRIIQVKDERFDDYVRELVESRGFGKERSYVGVEDLAGAEEVRKKLRQAGRHLSVAVKAFWEECPSRSCPAGSACRYHVRFTAYRKQDARTYKARTGGRRKA